MIRIEPEYRASLSAFENLTSLNEYDCAYLTINLSVTDSQSVLHGMTIFFHHENLCVSSEATESHINLS